MKTKKDFENFDKQNPQVYVMFCYFAKQVINKGYKNYSAEAIINQIRWWSTIETNNEDGFKINNDYKPYYARKWAKAHNNFEFFRNRKSVADINF